MRTAFCHATHTLKQIFVLQGLSLYFAIYCSMSGMWYPNVEVKLLTVSKKWILLDARPTPISIVHKSFIWTIVLYVCNNRCKLFRISYQLYEPLDILTTAKSWHKVQKTLLFFHLVQQPPVGQALLIHKVSRTHATTHQDSSGRVIIPSQLPLPGNINTHNRQKSMRPAGFEPTISAGERS
jgi:hypothetical protein